MELKSKYKAIIDDYYLERMDGSDNNVDKLEFIADSVFGFVTYDSEIDEILASKMIEVLNVLVSKTWATYTVERENYINFLTMVNMPFLIDKLDWSTSIRSSWLCLDRGLSLFHGSLVIEKGDEQISAFISALIEWSQE